MKTIVPNMYSTVKVAILAVVVMLLQAPVAAQAVSGSNNGLVFRNPVLQTASGTHLKKGAVYLFSNVMTNVNATVKIEDLVGGAQVTKIDDNTSGLGYVDALQPEVKIPAGTGEAYAVFVVSFINATTGLPHAVDSLRATALDLDGNLRLKEFVELAMGGGTASFMSTSLDISVLTVLLNRFRGENILGIERDGIDTSALGNMFTVQKTNTTAFTVKYGAKTVLQSGSTNRQFSLYMRGFQYPNQLVLLPVKLEFFNATLNSTVNRTELKWATSSEQNASHFVVEKSSDGRQFRDAGIVFAYGNTSEKVHYSFNDNISGADGQVIYYRLRAVDADGKNEHSATRIIRLSKNGPAATILAYPNPVVQELRVTVPAKWQGKRIVYELVNASAQTLIRTDVGSGSQTETLDLGKLAPGLYVVKVSCDGETVQQKIIKK